MTSRENTVFIGGIPYSIGEDKVVELLRNVGNVVSFRMLKDNESGRHRGHAFCDYENVAMANVAIEKLNGYEIEGRKLRVKFANEGKSGSGRGGSNVGAGRGQDIDWALNQLTNAELYDILAEMKTYIQSDPDEAKSLLQSKPCLTHALLKAQIRLDLIQQPPPSHMQHSMPPMPQQQMPPQPPHHPQHQQPPPHNLGMPPGMAPGHFTGPPPPGNQGQGQGPPPNHPRQHAPPPGNMMPPHGQPPGQQPRGPPPQTRGPPPPGQPPHGQQWHTRGPPPPHGGPPMQHNQRPPPSRQPPPGGFGGPPPPPQQQQRPQQLPPPQQQQQQPPGGGGGASIDRATMDRVLGYSESEVAQLDPKVRGVVQQLRAQNAQQNAR